MKASSQPPMNALDFNLTAEHLSDFLEKSLDLLANRTHYNKSLTNPLDDDSTNNSTRQQDCHGYCDSEMRQIFTEYRKFHGYITLVVS